MPRVYDDDDPSLRKRLLFLGGPNYYDSPEGTNPWEKLWGINKYALMSAAFATIGDCCFISQVKNISETLNVFGFYVIPAVGVASTFAAVTYIATDFRGKDDKLNYGLGVAACMPVLHAFKKKQAFTIPATLFLLAGALLKKDSKENNWNWWNPVTPRYDHWYDYSLVGTITEWPRRPY
ncbi:uncharacterized protein LOC107037666 [Diachasma alloeum]|uniref:NADH dehydrogenase [ubiquinone] 1 alpha subcomplex subunit 11 n=1 Tax=Diachasma alloeum TaxID=454923 RepID=A0A4E0RML1_9HYME|nr:uncharacterized protein LOC107037666 [Diachasma alloeum]THK33008.1 B14.7 subunit, NADH-dehydrogenase [Diachasma alloeum]